MSKDMTLDELKEHIIDAMTVINDLLTDWFANPREKIQKKSKLLAYWIKTYVKFLRKEDSFLPQSLPRYKRGSIIQVDFGYKIGSELGGLHYAVVLNKEPAYLSDTLTVIPLSSIKKGSTYNKYKIRLQDGVYVPLITKATALLEQAKELGEEAKTAKELFVKEEDVSTKIKLQAEYQIKEEASINAIIKVRNLIDSLSHLKEGSIALTGQITTISKIRIKAPIEKNDILYNVRLSEKDMETINSGLKELYFFESRKNNLEIMG